LARVRHRHITIPKQYQKRLDIVVKIVRASCTTHCSKEVSGEMERQ